jgi:Zn-dependent protease with chaperone function
VDFFERQEQSRRTGRWLVMLFVLAVLGTVFALDAVAYAAGSLFSRHTPPLVWVAVTTPMVMLVIGGAMLWRISSLAAGGAVVARDLGGVPVDPATNDPALRRLRNVVEETAIAAGIPVPRLFVMESEPAINAFAAGYGPDDAAICVTRGCLDQLDRDELQGVIGHEFSHILNGDMRMNIRLMGLLFGVLVLSVIGRETMAFTGRGRDNSVRVVALLGLGLWLVGSIGLFFARLIQAGVSRSRESLADASAVQFTRQTRGLAGALKKIAGLPGGSTLSSPKRAEVAHMLFGEASGGSFWFATHPPIIERIRALDPSFHEKDLADIAASAAMPTADTHAETPAASGFAGAAATAVASRVGTAESRDLARASSLRAALPAVLVAAARDPGGARALVAALLLAPAGNSDVVARQQAALHAALGEQESSLALGLQPQAAALEPAARLPLVDLCIPALRGLPPDARDALLKLARELAMADSQIDLFEYALSRLLRARLVNMDDPRGAARPGERKLRDARDAYSRLCVVVAQFGTDDPLAALRAWRLAQYEAFGDANAVMPPVPDWRTAFDGAVIELSRCNPASKELVVRGLWLAIAADGVVTVAEAECLRAICASLGCPLPPEFVDEARGA